MQKRDLVAGLCIVALLFVVGCATEVSEEELAKELDNLSEEELSYVLSEDEKALAGQASNFSPPQLTKLNSLRKTVKPYKVLCSDSDGGANYKEAGYVTLLNYPGGAINKSDRCWDDGKRLQEYVCEKGKYKGDQTVDCSTLGEDYGCEESKCLERTKFLIIVPSELQESAERLAEIRRSEGIPTVVQNIDRIDIDGDQNLLLNWLTNFKNNNPALRYLLLFGNSVLIPTFYSENPAADLETVTDFKYSLPQDNLPTLAVGRIPLRDTLQANVWIDKIEAYKEYDPDTDIFLFGATAEYDRYAEEHKAEIEGYGLTVLTYKPESNSSGADDILNETAPTIAAYDILSVAAPVIANEINEGKGFSLFYGHGSTFLFSPVFHISNIGLLSNKEKPTIVFTGGCDTVNYATAVPGIAEEFLLRENGAIAVVGATREGGFGFDYRFIPVFFKNCHNNRLGDVFNSAVENNYNLVLSQEVWTGGEGESQQDWANYFVERMTLLGDPTTLVCKNS